MIRHSGYKPVACSKCPKRFFSNADLRKHMDVHSDAKYVCNLCDATLSSKRSLDEHRSNYDLIIRKSVFWSFKQYFPCIGYRASSQES